MTGKSLPFPETLESLVSLETLPPLQTLLSLGSSQLPIPTFMPGGSTYYSVTYSFTDTNYSRIFNLIKDKRSVRVTSNKLSDTLRVFETIRRMCMIVCHIIALGRVPLGLFFTFQNQKTSQYNSRQNL